MPQGGGPPSVIVKALDAIEHVGSRVISSAIWDTRVRSVFSEEKKLSIAALSR